MKLNLPALPIQTSHQIYCIVKEALYNVQKHSQANLVTINSQTNSHKIILEIADNGIGFNPQQIESGAGLRGILERAQIINSELKIDTAPNQGTRIHYIILMDVRMPICNGVEATRIIHQRCPWIKILVLTTFDNDEYVWQSLEAGALSYLLKSTSSTEVITALRALNRGQSQLDSAIAKKVFSRLKPLAKTIDYQALLSKRELEVLELLGRGKSNKEIAKYLHLSGGTIRNHLSSIFCKLDVRDRTQAALWAQQHLGKNYTISQK